MRKHLRGNAVGWTPRIKKIMNPKLPAKFFSIFCLLLLTSCQSAQTAEDIIPELLRGAAAAEKPLPQDAPEALKKMLASAAEQTKLTKIYDPAYVVLDYPNGDVPVERGVCTDVLIRAMRASGIDLQKEVHEDMAAHFSLYPAKWGLAQADPNIDHRRVPNLQTFFTRKGKSLPVTAKAEDYKPGDFVSWDLDGKGMSHIGIVSNLWSEKNKRYLIIHNIGGGTQAEDRLFDWKVTGHYRYF
jgi:uncharacterized protein YijF (DUF1287 family)